MSKILYPTNGAPESSMIETLDNRDSLKHFNFDCVTTDGTNTKFTTTMCGYSREHAYRRLRIQTDGDILVSM